MTEPVQTTTEQSNPGGRAQGAAMQVGVDSFAARSPDNKISASESILNLVERIKLADKIGLDTCRKSESIIARNFSIPPRRG